ncbi:DUF1707 SHOCT-like domain-containing protein [Brevibacterium spongiae]|uniref:DUF1707 domain-containing protein n=1 Tax=Brevibacterium spongiae TaxID=2909672 RepID=A0ABY5SQ38_9MICO|nr:DUF1707 domain-containing protein [Brevibacterium spongiae]UVI35199.1 DUF1707 domain-containing protein [Brevibacterium spongiae]
MPEDDGEPDCRDDRDRAGNRLRIGDVERDAAIEVLRTAAGEGRITVEELDDRMELIAIARFPDDLDRVLADIVTELPSERSTIELSGAREGVTPETHAGELPGNREVLRSPWTGLTRQGRWPVKPYLRCEPAGVLLELNFLEVITDLEIIDIDVAARTGTLKLIVPDSWGVDSTGLARSPISVTTFKANETAQEGHPTIRVRGSIGSGAFIARGPNFRQRRRLRK